MKLPKFYRTYTDFFLDLSNFLTNSEASCQWLIRKDALQLLLFFFRFSKRSFHLKVKFEMMFTQETICSPKDKCSISTLILSKTGPSLDNL